MKQLLRAAAVIGPEATGPGWILLDDGHIAAVGAREAAAEPTAPPVTDLGAAGATTLAPGMIDVHIHGGAGHDFMRAGGDELAAVGRHLARHGVTAFLATTVTAEWETTRTALARLGDAVAKPPARGAAAALGLHLEGPFLSPRQAGVHPPGELRAPNLRDWDELRRCAAGNIRWLTIAPELEGALDVIAAAAADGVVVSLGHSDADAATARAAIDAGARHLTHAFNAMRPLHHREPTLLAEALLDANVTVEVIADGWHVAPRMVELLLRLKGVERTLLVSDGISATGRGDGHYQLGDIDVTVENGRCLAGGRLAGSTLTLDRAVQNALAWMNYPLAAVLGMATRNPGRYLAGSRGLLTEGAPADVVACDARGAVLRTWVRGVPVD